MKKIKRVGCFFLLILLVWTIISDHTYAAPCTSEQHEYKAQVVAFADAENDGVREFVCIYCGDSYTQVIPRTGHEYGDYQIEQEATCATQGLKYRECIECGKKEYEVIPFDTEHDFGEWQVVRQPSCEETGIRQRICKQCQQSEEEEFSSEQGHEYEEVIDPATCTEPGEIQQVCIHCGDIRQVETLAAIGHKYGEEVIKKEATEAEDGLAWRICEHDETHIQERVIPRLAIAQTEETETETHTEIIQETPETEPRNITPEEVAMAGVNVVTLGFYFIIIKSDVNIMRWEKRKRREVFERGGWK